jgi:hypothetical protein
MSTNEKGDFENVLQDELKELSTLREGICLEGESTVYQRASNSHLAGLALSGGGIRSATFNLGVIQALARYGLLSKFDYLSTVSGGGYIGGWLSALLHRKAAKQKKSGEREVNEQAVKDFQSRLKPHPDNSGIDLNVGFSAVEHVAVRYLRSYSNYISPKLGMSGDMLATVSICLRNFILIQLALVSLVASVLLAARIVATLSTEIAGATWLLGATVIPIIIAVFIAGGLAAERGTRQEKPASASRAVILCIIFPCIVAGLLFSTAITTRSNALFLCEYSVTFCVVFAAISYCIAWGFGVMAALVRGRIARDNATEAPEGAVSSSEECASWIVLIVAAAIAGALLGLLVYATAHYVDSRSGGIAIEIWHAVAFGPPLFLLGLLLVLTLHIGAASRAFSEHDREWLARLGGFGLMCAAVWAAVFAFLLYATPFVNWLAGGGLVALVTWAIGSGFGAWLGRSPATDGEKKISRWKELVTRIAPWLFVAGLAVIVAHGTHAALLELYTKDGYAPPIKSDFHFATVNALQVMRQISLLHTVYAFFGVALLFVVVVARFDINLFSLHAMYCNRLTRAYLGASRSEHRKPNPFSGFDINDDLPFAMLKKQRPIPIINTAINMTGGDDLAWQTRRAASFAFTPAWAGFETRSSKGEKLGAYRPTEKYAGGRPLGTLMAISGAAASPNMGYHTSAAVAALMTAFNLRLGRWCGNPAKDNDWMKESPWFSAKPIVAELSGSATAKAAWINLTDGGHFENLGVYELIRRRCRLIVVTDVGCDPDYHFEDLSNLLIKCWTDFGVNIRFNDIEGMRPKKDKRYCDAHAVIGRIEYHDDGPYGTIIYLKSSMHGDEWPDIRQYADTHKDFPHETTADQFFNENQFEAYRHLGYKVTAKMILSLEDALGQEPEKVTVENIAKKLLVLVWG